jgi:hypothetical protein
VPASGRAGWEGGRALRRRPLQAGRAVARRRRGKGSECEDGVTEGVIHTTRPLHCQRASERETSVVLCSQWQPHARCTVSPYKHSVCTVHLTAVATYPQWQPHASRRRRRRRRAVTTPPVRRTWRAKACPASGAIHRVIWGICMSKSFQMYSITIQTQCMYCTFDSYISFLHRSLGGAGRSAQMHSANLYRC